MTRNICCPVCNSTNNKELHEPIINRDLKKILTQKYKTYYCRSCNYYLTNPMLDLSAEECRIMYSDEYFPDEMTKWWENKRKKERKRVFQIFLQNSKNLIGSDKRNFLEIGSGEGYVLAEAKKMGWNVKGTDVYDNRKDFLKLAGIDFKIGNFIEQFYPPKYFDYIYLDSVLEHVPDPVNYIKKIYHLLKPDGLLYIAVPNENALIFKVRNLLFNVAGKKEKSQSYQPFLHPYHINGFTKNSFQKLLLNNNYELINYRNYAGWYEFLKYKFMSKGFIKNLVLLPIHLFAIVLQMAYYQDVICKKGN